MVEGIVILVNPHAVNTAKPSVVRELGNVMDVKAEQPINIDCPSVVREEPKSTKLREEQDINMLLPSVGLPLNVTDVSPVQLWNAVLPILVTLEGINTSLIPGLEENALAEIDVTEEGMERIPVGAV
jgi:hypothetical protein